MRSRRGPPGPVGPVTALVPSHRDRVTLIQARRRQTGHVIHRSNLRPGTQRPKGSWRRRKPRIPTRPTEPHEEQATVRKPRGGRGSAAVATGTSASPAGVAAENRACLPLGRAWRRSVRPWATASPAVDARRRSPPSHSVACSSTGSQYSARFPRGSGPSATSQRCRPPRSSRAGCRPAADRRPHRASWARAGGWTSPGPEPRRTGSTCAPVAAAPGCRSVPRPPR
jgi:hypothetical protein